MLEKRWHKGKFWCGQNLPFLLPPPKKNLNASKEQGEELISYLYAINK
jgi:hypothetical protein